MYQLDFDELTSFMQHKCASSVTMNETHESTLKSPKYLLKIQGNQIKALEELLADRYKVPRKYI